MKDKKLKRTLKGFELAAAKLSTVSSESCALDFETGKKTEVHQIAHGAAIGITALIKAIKAGDAPDPEHVARVVIRMAVQWEDEHPELMGEGGGGDE